MRKILTITLSLCVFILLTACGNTSSSSLSEEQIRQIVQEELKKSAENHTETGNIETDNNEAENTDTFGTPEDDYTKYFNFVLVDGKYCALSVKQNIEIPETLVVPNKYNGIDVVYTGVELISGLPVKTIIFESGVECSYSLCGDGNNCPTLEKIILLSENPDDCIVSKLISTASPIPMPLELNKIQLGGTCKIFVPDASLEQYKETWGAWFSKYPELLYSLSDLDENTAKYIK